ncbi:ABC transporter transmembrane region domain-containing protein [Sarocladium implicatum]|nr:ABC transporter transmembrane region domain-containing protein [Sarocladium implicatum]
MSRYSKEATPSKQDYPLTPVSLDDPPEYTNSTSAGSEEPSLTPNEPPSTHEDPSEVKGRWKHLFAFTRRSHAWPLAFAMVATVVAAGLKTLLAVLLGKTFDVMTAYASGTADAEETKRGVAKWCFVLWGVGGANWIANMAFLALWIAFGELQANSARLDMFDTLLWKDMSWFDSQEQGVSSLLVRVQTQTRELQLATSQVFGLLVCDVVTSIASLGIGLYFSWKLTLVLLATLPVSAIVLSLGTKKLQPAIMTQRKDLAKASQHATASITAIDLVKVFKGYDHELWQYYRAISQAARSYITQTACNSFQIGYVSFWVVAMFVVGFAFGVVLVDKDGLAPGAVVTTFYATLSSIQGVEALMPHWLVMSKGMAAGGFLSATTNQLRAKKQAVKISGGVRPEHCVGDVEVRDVSFSYPKNPETNVLNKSSFYFPAGEMTFVVGRSGSGKSTLGNLIANFYRPSAGDVLIDGHSIQILDRDWLQSNVTLIQQSSNLFSETLFMNVAFGHSDPEKVSTSEVLAACEVAHLQSTIDGLPQGLGTQVGSGAHNLSGGQKQRVSLARARLRDPPILILDEVTSGLDQFSRQLIMSSLRKWRQDKTTIIITHDISQIEEADFVYVLDNTVVVQQGFRRDLMRKESGFFASLFTVPTDQLKTPIEIQVTSADTVASSSASALRQFPSVSQNRLSQGFLEQLEGSSLYPGRPGHSRRSSLIIAADYALGFSNTPCEDCASEESSRPLSAYSSRELDVERRRFSRFVTDSFSLYEEPARDLEMVSLPQRGRSLRWKRVSPIVKGGATTTLAQPRPASPVPPATVLHTPNAIEDQSCDAVAEVSPMKASQKPVSLFAIIQTVWPLINVTERTLFITGIILCMIGACAMPAFSYCFAQLLTAMWSNGDKIEAGKMWAIYMTIIAIGDGIGVGCGRYMVERTAQGWINAIRMKALKRILLQPKPWFDKKENSPGRINECLDRNAEELRNIVGKFIPIVVAVIVMISFSIIWALIVSWKLTLVSLSPFPLVLAAVKGYSMVSSKWEAKCNKAAEDTSAVLTEVMLHIRVVRALTLEKYLGRKYRDSASRTLRLGFRRGWWSSPLFGLYQSMAYAMTALVFYYGMLLLVEKHEISLSEVLQVVNLLMFGIGTATGLLSAIPQLIMAQATASQLLGYTKLPTGPDTRSGAARQPQRRAASPLPVILDGVRFSYEGQKETNEVLKGATFCVEQGKCTAIVGPSGCGKSTVVSILLGLNSPTEEKINGIRRPTLSFGHVPSHEVDMDDIQSKVAYVSQTPFLFPASIADNIAYGLPQDSTSRGMNAVARAAEAAGLHTFISSLPNGYTTIVGDGGQTLSGGQAQRVNIARALIRRPQLLVMDEPTSALDNESAELIRQTIRDLIFQSKRMRSEMAIVLVTHSREMMTVADNIVVMDAGRVVEEGMYPQLWSQGGLFRHLVSGGLDGNP